MSFISGLFPALLLLAVLGIILVLHWTIQFRLRHSKRRSPFPENFLRNPGETLRKQIDDTTDDIFTYAVYLLMLPPLVFAGHISSSYFAGIPETVSRTTISILTLAAFMAFFLVKLVKSMNRRRTLRLGYDGELAVAQHLYPVMRLGYHVFHDFPCPGFNIDHIVVGPAGVFAVETKARRKPVLGNGKGKEEAQVIYNGTALQFPTWMETKPLEQAERQAGWLSGHLSKAVGAEIHAKPVLALPGWYIRRTSPKGIFVVNPKAFPGLLKRRELSDSMIGRIVHQLEMGCRDVEPNVGREGKK